VPLSSSGTQISPNPAPTPASSTKETPNSNPIGTPLRPKTAEFPKTTPPSPRSHRLGSAGGVPLGGDSVWLLSQDTAQQTLRVVETLAKDPDFIKAGFHIGRFITTTVDTEADCPNNEALWMDLDSASTWINVSTLCLVFCYRPCSILTPPFCPKTD
jgi:hypothetical protein